MINLIKNATEAEAQHIYITASIGENDETLIKVSNDGNPITSQAQEQIFIPFFTTKREGSGIGLSLSRQIQIMRAHNGNIELTKSNSKTTQFTLTFR